MRIGVAILLAVIASGCFALGATGQHLGIERSLAKEGTTSRALTFRRLMRLVTTPTWILGLLTVGVGAAIHVVALAMAPLTVIQPVGILAVPFSILLSNRIYRTKTSGQIWGAVALTIVGIVGFTVLSSISTTHGDHPHWSLLTIAIVVMWAIALTLAGFGWKGPHKLRCLLWASAGAVLYGMGSAFIKLLTVTWGQFHHPNFWLAAIGLLLAYAIGGWMIQQGYASGPAPTVVGSMTTVDPMAAVAFGLVVLNEGKHVTPPFAIGMALFAALACFGVFRLSQYHPDARLHEHDAERTGEPGADAPAALDRPPSPQGDNVTPGTPETDVPVREIDA